MTTSPRMIRMSAETPALLAYRAAVAALEALEADPTASQVAVEAAQDAAYEAYRIHMAARR